MFDHFFEIWNYFQMQQVFYNHILNCFYLHNFILRTSIDNLLCCFNVGGGCYTFQKNMYGIEKNMFHTSSVAATGKHGLSIHNWRQSDVWWCLTCMEIIINKVINVFLEANMTYDPDIQSTSPSWFQWERIHVWYGWVSARCNYSALAMELRLSCTNPSVSARKM